MKKIDENAIRAQKDKEYIEVFIFEYEPFIISLTQKIAGRFITRSDDQWSVALSAFNEAIMAYTFEKGGFIPFAETVIRRRLYDYIRKQSTYAKEISINPRVFESNPDEEDLTVSQQVLSKITVTPNDDAKLEIKDLAAALSEYGFAFSDLISVSPKALKTKTACAKAIAFITKNPVVLNELTYTKNLPIKVIEKNLHLPRKILERHRKYIIAGVEIISGNYPILSEYLKFVREELNR